MEYFEKFGPGDLSGILNLEIPNLPQAISPPKSYIQLNPFSSNLPYLMLAFSIFLTIRYYIKTHLTRTAREINKFPGGPILPFLGHVYLCIGNVEMNLSANFKKYGQITKFWMLSGPRLMVSNWRVCEKILSSSVHKGDDYKSLFDLMGNGLISSEESRWRHDRKLLNPSFNRQLFDGFLRTFNKESKTLVQLIKEKYPSEKDDSSVPQSIYHLILNAGLEMIFESSLGIELNIQQEGEKSNYVKAIFGIARGTQVRIFKPWIYNPIIFPFSATARNEKKAKAHLVKAVQLAITQRTQRLAANENNKESQKTKPFIDILLEMDPPMNPSDRNDHLNTIVAAAGDSTSLSIVNTLFFLAQYPEHQQTLHEEMDTLFPNEEDWDRDITMDDLAGAKFTEMCWKEAMRIRPSVAMISRRIISDIPLDDGKIIPSGSDAIFSIHHLHRDPTVFPEPERFNPYRFQPEEIAKRSAYSFIPFSIGPRNCIGLRYATMETKSILIHIMRRFHVSTNQCHENVEIVFGVTSEPNPAIKLKFMERKR